MLTGSGGLGGDEKSLEAAADDALLLEQIVESASQDFLRVLASSKLFFCQVGWEAVNLVRMGEALEGLVQCHPRRRDLFDLQVLSSQVRLGMTHCLGSIGSPGIKVDDVRKPLSLDVDLIAQSAGYKVDHGLVSGE